MPSDSPIPPLAGSLIEWHLRHPEAAGELVRIVNQLYALEVALATPGQNTRGLTAIVPAQTNLKLVLPFKFDSPIANSTATAASVSTQLNLVLAQLRLIGLLPT